MKRTVVVFALLLWCATGHAADLAAPGPANAPASADAGWSQLKGRPGFWRIGRDAGGAWWFVAPDGRREFLNSVTTVQPQLDGRDPDGALFLSKDLDPKLGDDRRLAHWASTTVRRVKDVGFKAIGAWSEPSIHAQDVPASRDLNLWTWVPWNARRLFSRGWTEAVEESVSRQVDPLRDNRNLVGYYLDNELDWTDAGAGPGVYFDYLPIGDPNRAEVLKIIATLWPTIDAFNAAWHTRLGSWQDLAALQRLPHEPQASYERLYSAWLSHLAGEYFRRTTALVRRHDPNHLILGVRYRGFAPPEVVAASREYTDAQSINYYPADAKLDREMFRAMHELSGQPVIVTEYSFHALDNRSGARNTFGFDAQVPDQQARADGYRLMTTRLARVPFVIGADWFQWMDEPPSGRSRDGEDVNFGVVDIDDVPYEPLAAAVRATTPLLNDLHAKSPAAAAAGTARADLWRETYERLPTGQVPYLAEPPRVNGELRDWPASAAIGGVRRTDTVGLERSLTPPPRVLMGWRLDGLYLGLEVFDADLTTLPLGGTWWTRDCVEFFVATRPVSPSQTYYDSNCHSFFFVPIPFPEADGQSGTVGQWKRPGDALKASRIPHADIRQVTRVLRDRYVVEMFIPASALRGFDPAKQPTIAFNVSIRDFQAAAESFWSAPKDALTQMRPNTWGTLELAAPTPTAPVPQPVADTGAEGITE